MGGSASKPFDYDAQLFADHNVQSEVVEGETPEDCSEIRRAKGAKELLKGPSLETGDLIKNIWHAFSAAVDKHPDKPFFGTRVFAEPHNGAYVWQTYKDIHSQSLAVCAALKSRDHAVQECVGLYSVNRAEWMIAAFGLWACNIRIVPLYATLGPDAVEYIAQFSEISTMFVSKENIGSVVDLLPKLNCLKTIVQFDVDEKYGNSKDTIEEDHLRSCKEHGVELIGFTTLLKEGADSAKHFPEEYDRDQVSHIMFTSGTTGVPKGAIVSHGNVLATVSSVLKVCHLGQSDRHISFLPLAHIFETCIQVAVVLAGCRVGFFQGDVRKLTDDFVALRPTILIGVPRVFTRVYQKVFSGVGEKGWPKRFIFHKGYHAQAEAVRRGGHRWSFYDSVVFSALARMIGLDETRIVVSGAAPLPPYLMEFLKVVINCDVVQGYGMTETAAGLTVSCPGDITLGHVGPPVECAEVMLRSVKEMGYDAKASVPKGEVLVRGPCVFQGYLKNEKATKETIGEDGWLATGDIGRWNPNGTLSIIDRKKNIFKLSQGEYVAAEHVESVYGKSPFVGQIWVYGNSFKSFLLAVVVPSTEKILSIMQEKGYWGSDHNATIGSEGFSEHYHQLFTEHYDKLKDVISSSLKQQQAELKGFEKIRDFLIESRVNNLGIGFTEENECMTPTFKLRRQFLLKRYSVELRELYAKNGEAPSPDEKWPGES